jgi:hypothetical protein
MKPTLTRRDTLALLIGGALSVDCAADSKSGNEPSLAQFAAAKGIRFGSAVSTVEGGIGNPNKVARHTDAWIRGTFTRQLGKDLFKITFTQVKELLPKTQPVYNDCMDWQTDQAIHRADGVPVRPTLYDDNFHHKLMRSTIAASIEKAGNRQVKHSAWYSAK